MTCNGPTRALMALPCLCAALLLGGSHVTADTGPGLILYVTMDGNDNWSGTLPEPQNGDGPLATLEGARDEIRRIKQAGGLPDGGVEVHVRQGTFIFDETLTFTEEDSGTAEAPIIYRTAPGDQVRLWGGRMVHNFTPVTDPAILSRLDEGVHGKVYQADLRALGITDLGEVSASGNRLELFFNDRPMRISRWPNEGFTHIVDVVEGDPVDVRGTKGDRSGKIIYEGDRPERWAQENDLWLHGYWFWDWSEQRMKVESIDTEDRVIALAPPQHGYGYRKNQWYYAFNALCEIDEPGEWYLDRETGILYFYPPEPIEQGFAVVSITPTLMTMNEASHVTVRGFIFEAGRNHGLTINGGTGVRVIGCTFRNLGEWAVRVSGGADHGVVGCDIYETGSGGIALSGGDRTTLTPAGHFADNNHIYEYARWNRVYQPGITLQGVGNRAAHNLIHNAPHMGMGFGGNDHLIEFNEIHSVSYESNDAGAIYTGRNWTMRGHMIRHNYMHNISGFRGRGCVGVYLDDMFSSADIIGNVFYRVTRAAMVGGGRDCRIENNIFVDCTPAVHVDARALGWAHGHADGWLQEAQEKGTLSGIAFDKPPYSERYPALATILENEPKAPVGNIIARNVFHGGRWDGIHGNARQYVTLEDNLIDEDPLFVDLDNLDFQLRNESPAFALGFERIPINRIGLIDDDTRASWPVHHTVRPAEMPAPPPRAARAAPAVFRVTRAPGEVTVDGDVAEAEWGGEDRSMLIQEGIQGEKSTPTSRAWVAHDGTHLLVAIVNSVDGGRALRPGNTWGQDDAVEIALRNPGAGERAPILVLRGFPSGHFESSTEAGAPTEAAERAAGGMEYAARVVNPGQWATEWRIPFASLGIDPAEHRRLPFNISVRKSAQPLWQMWQGTGGMTWDVHGAGIIELVP